MGGTNIETYTLVSGRECEIGNSCQLTEDIRDKSKITFKGEIGLLDLKHICKSIEERFDEKELDENISIVVYIVPGHIEKRALEYGEQHGLRNSYIVIPTSSNLEIELREKIIYSIYYHLYSKISLSKEGMVLPWFVHGFSHWNTIQQMKSVWSKEEYRLRVERCYIRTFSLDRELKETILDSGYNQTSTLSRDAGAVLCHQLSILFKERGKKWEYMMDTVCKNSIIDAIESCYSGDLVWLWSLSLYSSDLSGWLEVCKRYISIDGWKLECPKRGPVKVTYV